MGTLFRALLLLTIGFVAGVATVVVLAGRPDRAPLLPASQAVDRQPDITVGLSAALLTALIQQSIARGESPVPLSNVRVEADGGSLVVRGDTGAGGLRVVGAVTMQPVIAGGALRMRVTDASLGPLPVPDDLARLAESPINQRLAVILADLPATLTSARVAEDGLQVTARVRVNELAALTPAAPRR